MTAVVLEIVERLGFKPFEKPLSRWRLREAGSVSLESVAADPNLTLFCLDPEQRQAIFVETPPELDLTQAPFLAVAQWEAALKLVAVPYDELIALADSLDPIEPPILIYSIGRCGSTLFSNILNETPAVTCFSEPEFYNQIHEQRWLFGANQEDLAQITRACTRLLCKPSPQKAPDRYAIKFRNWILHEADLYNQALPGTTNVFMYRGAEAWARSYFRLLPGISERLGGPLFAVLARLHPGLGETLVRHQRLTAEVLGAMWLAMLRDYIRLESDIPFMSFKYEDIVTHQDGALEALFDYCNMPLDQLELGKKALGRDSQEGTFLGYEQRDESRVLGTDQMAALRSLLEAQTDRDWLNLELPGARKFTAS